MKKCALVLSIFFCMVFQPGAGIGQMMMNPFCATNYTEGIELYNNAVALLGDSSANDADSALVYFTMAAPYLERVEEGCPGDTNTLTALSGIYYALNDLPKSIAYKNKCDSARRDQRLWELTRLSDSCAFNGDTAQAIAYYSGVLAVDSSCVNRAHMARLYRQFICCEEGEVTFSRNYHCAVAKGDLMFELKKYEEAIVAYEEALKYNPDESHPKHMIDSCRYQISIRKQN